MPDRSAVDRAGERVYHARVSTDGGSAVPEAPKFGSLGKALSHALSPIVTVVSIAAVVVAIVDHGLAW